MTSGKLLVEIYAKKPKLVMKSSALDGSKSQILTKNGLS